MRFDSSKAWNDAAALVAANRDVLLALAGVFLVLPLAALAIFAPQPEAPQGATPEELFQLIGDYYKQHWLKYVGVSLVTTVGTLAMLALFTDRSRPTVAEAIKLGALGTLPVIAAQLLMGMGLALAAILPVTLLTTLGVPALAVLAIAAALVLAVWVWTRCSLVSPAVIVEGMKNPIAALQRSWQLTKGNAGRLLAFMILVGIAFIVSIMILQMLIGLVLSLIMPGEAAAIANALVAAMLQATMSVYFVGVIAAAHRQLAGPAAEVQAQAFD